MGANLKQNKGRGSNYIWQLITAVSCICCSCWTSSIQSFWEGHLGSDFVVGSWGFFITAVATIPLAFYLTDQNYTNMMYYVLVGGAFCFAIGAFLFAYTSYPATHRSSIVWSLILYILCCAPQSTNESSSDERRPLV